MSPEAKMERWIDVLSEEAEERLNDFFDALKQHPDLVKNDTFQSFFNQLFNDLAIMTERLKNK